MAVGRKEGGACQGEVEGLLVTLSNAESRRSGGEAGEGGGGGGVSGGGRKEGWHGEVEGLLVGLSAY